MNTQNVGENIIYLHIYALYVNALDALWSSGYMSEKSGHASTRVLR